MAYKVFSNGSVLNASDLNDYLMRQSVMVFSSSTARDSAITGPTEGMVSYLEDTNAYQFYNGSAWTNLISSTSGLEHITTQTFTGVASVSVGSNATPVFSSTYDNYRIVLVSEVSTSTSRTFSLRMRQNTTDITSSNYQHFNQGLDQLGNAQNSFATNQSSAVVLPSAHYTGLKFPIAFDIFSPFLTAETMWNGLGTGITSASNFSHRFSGRLESVSSQNGFTILNSSGNFTNGQVSIYGYRKA
jgi:hypothetical protein